MKTKTIVALLVIALAVISIGVASAGDGLEKSNGPNHPEDRCCYCDLNSDGWTCDCIGDCCLQCTCTVCDC